MLCPSHAISWSRTMLKSKCLLEEFRRIHMSSRSMAVLFSGPSVRPMRCLREIHRPRVCASNRPWQQRRCTQSIEALNPVPQTFTGGVHGDNSSVEEGPLNLHEGAREKPRTLDASWNLCEKGKKGSSTVGPSCREASCTTRRAKSKHASLHVAGVKAESKAFPELLMATIQARTKHPRGTTPSSESRCLMCVLFLGRSVNNTAGTPS